MDSETRPARRGHSSPCLRQTRSKEVQGTRFGIIAFVAASLALTLPAQSRLHETLANATRPSPDDRWKVNWRCRRAGRASLLFLANQAGKFFSAIHVSPAISRRSGIAILQNCLLLDASDNANTFLWLFRIRNHQKTSAEDGRKTGL